jgi:hypothetical protein
MRPAQREHSGQFVRQRLTNYFLSHSFTNTLRNSRNSPTADLILYICGSNDFCISGWQRAAGSAGGAVVELSGCRVVEGEGGRLTCTYASGSSRGSRSEGRDDGGVAMGF